MASRKVGKSLPLLRLPALLFPSQPISLRVHDALSTAASAAAPPPPPPPSPQQPTAVPRGLLSKAWRDHGSKLFALGPCGRIGIELTVMFDQMLDAAVPTPPGVAHAHCGERMRMLSCSAPSQSEETSVRAAEATAAAGCNATLADWPAAALERVTDGELSPARLERLHDDAPRVAELALTGVARGAFALEPSHRDEELSPSIFSDCDPRCHPLFPRDEEPPSEAEMLSFWLAARLPLSTSLRASLLACTCPLKRLHDVQDVMRLLIDPDSHRFANRLRLVVETPVSDGCHTFGGVPAPRTIVAEAAPRYSWSADDAFPHG